MKGNLDVVGWTGNNLQRYFIGTLAQINQQRFSSLKKMSMKQIWHYEAWKGFIHNKQPPDFLLTFE